METIEDLHKFCHDKKMLTDKGFPGAMGYNLATTAAIITAKTENTSKIFMASFNLGLSFHLNFIPGNKHEINDSVITGRLSTINDMVFIVCHSIHHPQTIKMRYEIPFKLTLVNDK